METLEKKCERFLGLVTEGKRNRVHFTDICAELHVSPGDMDEILCEKTGYSGEELVRIWGW